MWLLKVLLNGTQLDKPLYLLKINDWPTNIMIRNEWKRQQHNRGDLQNKHEVDMHYLAPFHRSKLFDPLQQTITEIKKLMMKHFIFLMVQHSPTYVWTIIYACLHAWACLVTTCHITMSSCTHLTNHTQEKPPETFLFEWPEISHTCCLPL